MKNKFKLINSKLKSNTDCSGSLDHCEDRKVFGWFLNGKKSDIENLKLYVDGTLCQCKATSYDREDVASLFSVDKKCGFIFDLSHLEDKGTYKLSVKHEGTRFNFRGKVLSYFGLLSKHRASLMQLVVPEYYKCKHDLIDLTNQEAINHYLMIGVQQNYDPNPWFSSEYIANKYPDLLDESGIAAIAYLENEKALGLMASPCFDSKFYFHQNPDCQALDSLLAHFVTYGRNEGRLGYNCFPGGTQINQINAICEIEPDCAKIIDSIEKVVRYPKILPHIYLPHMVEKMYGNRIKAIVTVPFISLGGADLISTFVLKALQQEFGEDNVLLIVTDHKNLEVPEWISSKSNVLVLDQLVSYRNDVEKVNSLQTLVGVLAPEKVVNVNSSTCWKMFKKYGQQLSSVVNLYAYLFCFDYNEHGTKVGYITDYIRDTIDYLTCVNCDNQQIISDIQALYSLPPQQIGKFKTVYVPLPARVGKERREGAYNQKKILWVGRLSNQKRPDILVEIAGLLKDYKFTVFGPAGNSELSESIIENRYSNIDYRGVYSHLDELDMNDYDLFLNTSEWEGLPTIIIQMLHLNMPVVTSNVGGISELVNSTTGWVVNDDLSGENFVKSIRLFCTNEESVVEKVRAGRKAVDKKHNWEVFAKNINSPNTPNSANLKLVCENSPSALKGDSAIDNKLAEVV